MLRRRPSRSRPRPPPPGFAGGLVQLMFELITVLALLAGALWAVKRMGGRRLAAGSLVNVIGGVSVGSRERVMVVEVADQWIVIGVAPAGSIPWPACRARSSKRRTLRPAYPPASPHG